MTNSTTKPSGKRYDPNAVEPMFVMSMYMNKESLCNARYEYLMSKMEWLERRLEIADPDGESIDMVYDENGEYIDYG